MAFISFSSCKENSSSYSLKEERIMAKSNSINNPHQRAMKSLILLFVFLALLWKNPLLYGGSMNPIYPAAGRALETPRFGEPKTIKTPAGRELYLIANLLPPSEKPRGIVLYFHGNGEVVEDLDYVLPFFRKVQWDVFLIEYPGYGHAPGNPSEKELYQTALSAYDWARKEYPTRPIFAAGWSLGSSVAAKLAVEREVKHLLLLSAMTSMRDVILHLFPTVPPSLLEGNEFDTARFIKKLRAPVSIIHGEKDNLVPIEMGRELKRLLGEKARFISVPKASHNNLYLLGETQIESEILRIAGIPY
jgi:uncharacterized protein